MMESIKRANRARLKAVVVPDGYRLLTEGEVIPEDSIFWHATAKEWRTVEQTVGWVWTVDRIAPTAARHK